MRNRGPGGSTWWIWDGAKEGTPKNAELIAQVVERTGLQVEVGGGIRNMATVDRYLELGAARVILGSAALRDPQFVAEAVKRYGKRVAVGIDALEGKVAAEGWLEQSQVDYLELARRMEDLGVQYLICTDISQDGTLAGPNLTMLDQLNQAVSCHVVASGGVSSLLDIVNLYDLGLYGAIAGKALYTGALDLRAAIAACRRIGGKKGAGLSEDELDLYFRKSDLIPAIIQDDDTGEVLMLAYMNRESFRKSWRRGPPGSTAAAARPCGTRGRPPATPRPSSASGRTATTTHCCCGSSRRGRPATPAATAVFTKSFGDKEEAAWICSGNCTPRWRAAGRKNKRALTPATCSRRAWIRF